MLFYFSQLQMSGQAGAGADFFCLRSHIGEESVFILMRQQWRESDSGEVWS